MSKQQLSTAAIDAIKNDEQLWRAVSDALGIRSFGLRTYLNRRSDRLNHVNVVESVERISGMTRSEILEDVSIERRDADVV